MRQTLSRGMVVAAAATSVLSLCGSPALADSQADGAAKDSPGVVSGNAVQVPIDIPVNACGNTVDVIAALNPAFGNACANTGADDQGHGHGGYGHDGPSAGHGGHGGHSGPDGAAAQGHAVGSPGVGSGNNAQVPVDIPVNACGNTVDVIAALNPAFGNSCENGGDDKTPPPPGYGHEEPPHTPPPTHHTPPPEHHTPPPQHHTPPPAHHTPPPAEEEAPPAIDTEHPPALAETGSHGDALAGAAAGSAALIAAGAVLYRRSRTASRR
ncbi:hypothetical protein GCM10010259_24360 [Streptomyces daghestanicus]|uniref:Chaplin domain-containing protein n=2 Tax=Streptomyces daghestanicus TaxID=66885 RepID=A0ABQ3QA62_9ACTN|nr:hypothetical protein GCM10010259_24360 [Streptomyces daghestanicus]GHI34144.1 hypothetical protein Sdagh_58740 [Streptomyces daghestanicus]